MRIASKQPSEAKQKRIGALSVLPVFLSLQSKRAIVVGGSDAAAWKAELLAAAGANVEVFAGMDCLSADMIALFKNGAAAGSLSLAMDDWRQADFKGACLAIADLEDEEAMDFAQKARAAGVPLNVIDKPIFCEFQFGSIVNRSPVVVGISTDGAAPILGQAVRRRIETLLPQSLADWAKLAARVRAQVMRQFRAGPERRRFWENFAFCAFLSDDVPATADAFMDGVSRTSAFGGKVTLVGSGPGDAEHLTLKAMRTLQSADVIIFDNDISANVLELARREAKRLCVGKSGGLSDRQPKDNYAMMLSFAKQGKHVVRLKSGDLTKFSDAREEIAKLEANGIPVALVPGISVDSVRATSCASPSRSKILRMRSAS